MKDYLAESIDVDEEESLRESLRNPNESWNKSWLKMYILKNHLEFLEKEKNRKSI